MKKFKFSLSTVLNYKTQLLDDLKKEHALMLAGIRAKEEEIAFMENGCAMVNGDYNAKKLDGLCSPDALSYEAHIRLLRKKIKEQKLILKELIEQAEHKQRQIIEAKKEVASYEKLREKHLEQYIKLEQKSEETFIDEFVSYKRSVNQ